MEKEVFNFFSLFHQLRNFHKTTKQENTHYKLLISHLLSIVIGQKYDQLHSEISKVLKI